MQSLSFWSYSIIMGFLDSMNPFSVAAMVAMLTRKQFRNTGVGFILGTLFAYFVGGLCLHFGFKNFLSHRLPPISDHIVFLIYVILAFVLLAYSLKLWKTKAEPQVEHSNLIETLPKAFMFGMVSTFMDLSSALPYFLVLGRIGEEEFSLSEQIFALGVYNFIYVLPLALLLIIRLRMTDSSTLLKKMKSAVFYFERRLLPPMLVCCAGVVFFYAVQIVIKNF